MKGEGISDLACKKLPWKSPVLLGLIHLLGVLLNCKLISGEPRASEVPSPSHCNKPTSCYLQANMLQVYNSASFDLRVNESESCKPVSSQLSGKQSVVCSILKSMTSIFLICILKFYISSRSCRHLL